MNKKPVLFRLTHVIFKLSLASVFFTTLLYGQGDLSGNAAVPAFLVDQDLRLNLVSMETPLQFFVATNQGVIEDVKVQLRSLATPDGSTHYGGIAIRNPELGTLDPAGKIVGFQPSPEYFRIPGDYRVDFILEGRVDPDGSPIRSLASVTVHIQAAELEDLAPEGETLRFYRPVPFFKATGTAVLRIRETTGRTAIRGLELENQGLYSDKKTEPIHAETRFEPKNIDRIEAGSMAVAKVRFEEIGRTGVFTTKFRFQSADLEEPLVVSRKIEITDRWLLPLLTIFLGVAAGFFMHYLVKNRRPHLLNRHLALQLEGELNDLLALTENPEKKDKLLHFRERLQDAQTLNTFGKHGEAATGLASIEKDLEAWRQKEFEEKGKLYRELQAFTKRFHGFNSQEAELAEPEERENLADMEEREADCRHLLGQGKVDAAAARLDSMKRDLDGARKTVLRRLLNELLEQIRAWRPSHETGQTEKTELEKLTRKDLEELYGDGDPAQVWARWRERASHLKHLIASDSGRGKSLSLGTEKKAGYGIPGLGFATEFDIPDEPQLHIADAVNRRTTDLHLTFEIKAPEETLAPDTPVTWHFGSATREAGLRATHRFRETGTFTVKAEIKAKDGRAMILEETVRVLPGRTQQNLNEVAREVKAIDLVQSGVAVVLATLTGFFTLYLDQVFGSAGDYLTAFLWGFGIDNGVRGFAAVFEKLR